MSVTIHYFGKVSDPAVLRDLVEDYEEIARVSGWTFERVDHVFTRDQGPSESRLALKGIRITLGLGATPLLLTFDQEGHLAHIYYEPVSLSDEKEVADRTIPRRLLHQVHAHTTLKQADPHLHVTLVKLLDHLKKRYVPNLEVIDNTGYWHSRDEALLRPRVPDLILK